MIAVTDTVTDTVTDPAGRFPDPTRAQEAPPAHVRGFAAFPSHGPARVCDTKQTKCISAVGGFPATRPGVGELPFSLSEGDLRYINSWRLSRLTSHGPKPSRRLGRFQAIPAHGLFAFPAGRVETAGYLAPGARGAGRWPAPPASNECPRAPSPAR